MAQIDHEISQWLSRNIIYLVLAVVVIWVVKVKGKDIRHRWFALVMHLITKDPDPKLSALKKEFLSDLATITSQDPELRKQDRIKILEIGVGTGANFAYYPDGSHLIVVDPNPHFAKYYNENRMKFPNIKSEEILVTTGEDMSAVPDNSVDAVVVTLVFCSVDDVDQIIREIKRVLVPGGKFFLWEHIGEFNGKEHWIRKAFQDCLSLSRVWPFLFDGCCLNRDCVDSLQKAGFSKVDFNRKYAPMNNIVFEVLKPHLNAVATK